MDRKKKAKLSLKRETLRKLDDQHLAQVAGGTLTVLTNGGSIVVDPAVLAALGLIGTSASVLQCTSR